MDKSALIEEMYNEITFLRNFKADIHFSLKHIKKMEKELIYYKDRIERHYASFKTLSEKHLGVPENESTKIIEEILLEIQEDLKEIALERFK